MPRLLLVEDDVELADAVEIWLKREDYCVDMVSNGADGLGRLLSSSYDLAVLDVNLPGMNGLDILHQFRKQGGTIPVLILTARTAVEEKEAGLDTGADDYLTKPFNLKELSARLRSLMRRGQGQLHSNIMRNADIELDLITHRVTRNGRELDLRPRELALLEFLMRYPGEIFSVDVILDRVWPTESEATIDSVRSAFYRIRQEIDGDDAKSLIETIPKVGYRLRLKRE